MSEHLNLLNNLSLRALGAFLTALVLVLLSGPRFIRRMQTQQVRQIVRDDGPQSHLSKAGTPTMGGVLILLALIIASMLWGDLSSPYLALAMFVTVAFGAVGYADDYLKLSKRNSKGLPARYKYLLQSIIAICAVIYLYFSALTPMDTQLIIPFLKGTTIQLGWCYIVLGYFVVVGSSNAVNLTDGLDGLASLPVALVAIALAVVAFMSAQHQLANHFNLLSLPAARELTIFCMALAGSCLGFLVYNKHPARIFMGDVGSLSLGAALGIVAVMVRQEILLFIMGVIFVAETVSVILQVGYFKMTRKRIFKMAPLHHHYELKGWKETKVVRVFWLVTLIAVCIGLSSLFI